MAAAALQSTEFMKAFRDLRAWCCPCQLSAVTSRLGNTDCLAYLVFLRSEQKTEAKQSHCEWMRRRFAQSVPGSSPLRLLYLELGVPFRMPPPQILAIPSSRYVRMDISFSLSLVLSPFKFVLKILTCGRVTGGDNFRAAVASAPSCDGQQ